MYREAVDVRRLWLFLESPQADVLAKWQGRGKVKDAVVRELKSRVRDKVWGEICVRRV